MLDVTKDVILSHEELERFKQLYSHKGRVDLKRDPNYYNGREYASITISKDEWKKIVEDWNLIKKDWGRVKKYEYFTQ